MWWWYKDVPVNKRLGPGTALERDIRWYTHTLLEIWRRNTNEQWNGGDRPGGKLPLPTINWWSQAAVTWAPLPECIKHLIIPATQLRPPGLAIARRTYRDAIRVWCLALPIAPVASMQAFMADEVIINKHEAMKHMMINWASDKWEVMILSWQWRIGRIHENNCRLAQPLRQRNSPINRNG